MDNFIKLPAHEKRDLIEDVASRKGVDPVIIEKDFWVCMVLDKLFSSSFERYLTFKGGTSLSKVYKVIERFSEDIDLTISKNFIRNNSKLTSDRPDKIVKATVRIISQKMFPEIQKMLSEFGACELSEQDKQTIMFNYTSCLENSNTHDQYISESIKMEFGARGENEPSSKKNITPYIAEISPELFDNIIPEISVTVLNVERTFWEKATILHSIHYQPEDRKLNDRMSRHYHDVYMLAQDALVLDLVSSNIDLLKRVVDHKKKYFKDKWDWYGSATIGQLKLVPSSAHDHHLMEDYKKMEVMFFNKPLAYKELIAKLSSLEKHINNLVSRPTS